MRINSYNDLIKNVQKYKNEPKYIPVIANKIAEIKNVSVNQVMDITTSNAKGLFDF